jgi:hypothetical protein
VNNPNDLVLTGGSANGPNAPLSGGAAFGVFLLVLVVVSIASFVGIVIFLKVKRPESYLAFKTKLKLTKA